MSGCSPVEPAGAGGRSVTVCLSGKVGVGAQFLCRGPRFHFRRRGARLPIACPWAVGWAPVDSLDDAIGYVLAGCDPLAPVPVAPAALGLVLAGDVVAAEAVPPFANTAMDGYAVRAADTGGAAGVAGEAAGRRRGGGRPPGRTPARARRGDAHLHRRPIPDGADAVVMVERTRRADGEDGSQAVQIDLEVAPATTCGRRART